MNFFKSILSDDPDPPIAQGSEPNSPTGPDQSPSPHDDHISTPNSSDPGSGGGLWSFGGLVKTLTTRSESVLETYRRDLKEFGSGLKKETALFRKAASRVVKELPASIEVGASSAHGALDGVLKSTADAISHGKDALLAASSDSEPSPDTPDYRTLTPRLYSRFDSQLIAIRSDVDTYCEDPDDLDDYGKWKLGFVLDENRKEVENLMNDDLTVEGIYKRVVPNQVDHDTFWCRYFYRVHKLKQQEALRANLVRRARSIDDEEELSWDVEDDDDEETNVVSQGNALKNKEDKDLHGKEKISDDESDSGSGNVEKKSNVVGASGENLSSETKLAAEQSSEGNNVELVSKGDVGVAVDGKGDNGGSCKDSVSVVSTQPSLPEDEDLGWDEIEDLGSHDEKIMFRGETLNKADVRKPLSAAEEDEDLNWDIEEEEDEPIKA